MTDDVLAKLDKFPAARDPYWLADYVELLCLADMDGLVSRADLLDRWYERADVGEAPEEPEAEGGEGIGAGAAVTPDPVPIVSDRRRAKADDVFRHLDYRRGTFGAAYPFSITTEGALSRLVMTPAMRLYVFLLLAANLTYVMEVHQHAVSRAFERFSLEAMKAMLPPTAAVHAFGTAAQAGDKFHGGTLFDKLGRLAADLSESLSVSEADFRVPNVGDGGADVVAWIPLGDSAPGLAILIAQATCQVNWRNKKQESSVANWRGFMTFMANHTPVLCIPQCFRDSNGDWAVKTEVSSSILLDRVRLEWLTRGLPVINIPIDLIDAAVAFREPVI